MNSLTIFGSQLMLSLIAFTLIARWYVSPWLSTKSQYAALMVLIFPHAFRHIGLGFLVPGLVDEQLPTNFALAAAYGDFASGLLALLSLVALRKQWTVAIPLVWVLNILGTVDLLNALSHAEAVPYLQTMWCVPTFFVPLLLVSHVLIFNKLLKSN